MKRLTDKHRDLCLSCELCIDDECDHLNHSELCSNAKRYKRLADIEDILGDDYDLESLYEITKAVKLIGNVVYELNKRGFISTYEIISIHISKCSILVGWNLVDGIYSNVNGFEISALGKTVFLTREAAEAALKGEQHDI